MTVGELIQELKYMDEDATVRFASQPSWPFEYSINGVIQTIVCLLYTSPSPRDRTRSRMPSSA